MTARDEHLEAAAAHEAERHASIERSDTDGFVSQWASGLNAQLERRRAQLAADGGVATFRGLYHAATGVRVQAKIVDTRYGRKWLVLRSDGSAAHWITPGSTRGKIKAAGLVERDELAPATADHWSPPGARGLSGATSVQVVVSRTDGGYPDDAIPFDRIAREAR